jgi:hypothetical protein
MVARLSRAAEQGRNGAGVGGEAALEHHRRFGPLETRQPLFQLDMQGHGAGDGADRARADAERLDRLARPLAQQRVRRQAEVVVRRQVDHRSVIEFRARLLLAVEHTQSAEESLFAKRRELTVEKAQGVERHRTGQYMACGRGRPAPTNGPDIRP